ncbi:MAG: 3-phosphoshikimate 1-carboxyvinyltransferase, partial [Gammaproteobacteria bacterium]|nr:3-phosphoshikimate 1-carboxyvinyltransferase [Gammaproteobacteria bacterium]
RIPGDVSSATFFVVGAAITAGSDLTLLGAGVNATRTGALDILRLMGADIVIKNRRLVGAEPVADIRVRGSRLSGIDIPTELVPLAIDEFPVLFIAAAAAQGTTRLTGAAELRVKESDRLAVMAEGLERLGVVCELADDGIRITGGPIGGGAIDSHADHRIAMAFAMAGLVAEAPITIRDATNIDTSFPGFRELAASAGLAVRAPRK